jgi:adenylosuccinate synthase
MNNMASNTFINSSTNRLVLSEVRQPDEVKIKLKHGEWEVEITCLESKVKTVVETVLSSLDSTKLIGPSILVDIDELRHEIEMLKSRSVLVDARSSTAVAGDTRVITKGGMTCRGLLETLWFEGYFSTERSLGDVHEELSRRGYNYDRTAVSHSLTDMVRENIMTRNGTMRNYRYIQKRPPSDTDSNAIPND